MAKNKLAKLLESSISQHGLWLINNLEYIREDLEFLLKWHGGNVKDATAHLDDIDSGFVIDLYAKIKKARSAA